MVVRESSRANDLAVQQLRSFCAVYHEGSYAKAANACDLAVPTVWEQVHAVERCYGVKLFSRHGRGVAPTKEAHVLFASLGPILTGLDSTFDEIKDGTGPKNVKIVTGMRMLLEELGSQLKRFVDANPGTTIELIHGDKASAEQLVLSDEVDFGLTLAPRPNMESQGILYEKAYSVDYLALVPRGHALESRARLRLKDITSYPLIVGHPGTAVRQVLDEALYREELTGKVEILVETDNSAFTAACVRAGLGIGVLAGKFDGFLTDKLVGLSLKQQLGHARIVFIRKAGRHLSQAASGLMGVIKQGVGCVD